MMQKQVFYFCCFALPALWLTACEQGSDANQEHGELVPLSVNELTLTGETVTRVAEGPVTTDGAAIGVFLTTQNGYTPEYNHAYTYSSAGGGWSSTAPIWVDGRKAKIIGVYDPNNVGAFPASNTSAVSNATLTAQAYSDDLLSQLWYMDDRHTEVNCFAASVAFTMRPAYSRLSLSISRSDSYPFACKVSQIVIKPSSGTFYTAGKVNVADGSVTGTAVHHYAIDTSLMPMNTTGLSVGSADTSIDLLFPPQRLAPGAGLTFTLTTDGHDYSVTVPAATFNIIQAGVHYTVQLEMAGIGLVTSSVTTADWLPSGTNIDSKLD